MWRAYHWAGTQFLKNFTWISAFIPITDSGILSRYKMHASRIPVCVLCTKDRLYM